ncbi:tRNA lysidine(34) synthetase TilS [Leifsonia sp. Root112D2]|uniref:tRNA lysidine(34) synthetase TilS n=1 Tax=Leifsonia sp. Root112D2 TaxID=1736426 RepID=UPI0006F7283A|nr:tRNA lysidine(34) synthetase TilS [Leifsonia sp. Root112D2]KQV07027.1 tRNA(Ile)-lysidine synthetase [Leifsonia sp. Root112D2]
MQPDVSSARRPRLTPAIADIRRAVRAALVAPLNQNDGESAGSGHKAAISGSHGEKSVVFDKALVLVGLSGGADSLALAAATNFEAPRAGIQAGVVIVDHGLQEGSSHVAAQAAQQARDLGLNPVLVKRVVVSGENDGGPEAAAREARYGAFAEALAETGASAVLLAHTLDDQAETVLLGLARGSGAASLQGMAPQNGPYLRPLLGIRRATTRQFCVDSRLEPWDDPQNLDPAYARVRVRQSSLPTLEADLGPGIAEALARTAEQLREDADALDAMIVETIEDICEHAEAGISVSVGALAANPPALRHRIIRYVAQSEFGVSLERVHTLAVARLVTDWHGQEGLDLPGVRVVRQGGRVIFTRA